MRLVTFLAGPTGPISVTWLNDLTGPRYYSDSTDATLGMELLWDRQRG